MTPVTFRIICHGLKGDSYHAMTRKDHAGLGVESSNGEIGEYNGGGLAKGKRRLGTERCA